MTAFIEESREADGVEPIGKVVPIAPSTDDRHAAGRADPGQRSARAQRPGYQRRSGCVAGLQVAPTPSRRDNLLARLAPHPGHGVGSSHLRHAPARHGLSRVAGWPYGHPAP
jgi:hypothetical protein